jgi:sporulation protein YlmC with PRC-barrel domain
MTVRISQLVGKAVRTKDGKHIGHVREIRAKESCIEILVCGPKGWLQRISSFHSGRRVRWDRVLAITSEEIICDDKPRARKDAYIC